MHKLMIKTHSKTGLKYLCYTQKEDHISYLGSGIHWKRHLKQHGKDIKTEVIFESENYDEFVKVAKETSVSLNVVEDNSWANLKIEEGEGGDTVSSKRWITNGIDDKYHPINQELPNGWKLGRTNCVFNQKEFQKNMSKRGHAKQTYEIRKLAAAKATETKKLNNTFPDISGDKNPTKLDSVKKKLKIAVENRPYIKCPNCNKEGRHSPGMFRFHFDNCKYANNKN